MGEDNLGQRSIAALIDLVICTGLFAVVFYFFSREVHRDDFTVHVLNGWPSLFIPAIWLFYYPYTESYFERTLGKFLCGQKVVSCHGGVLTFKQAFLRRILDPLEVWFAFGLVGWIIVGLSNDGRRLGDKLGDTRVVNANVQPSAAPNGGPASGGGNPNVNERPPSVS